MPRYLNMRFSKLVDELAAHLSAGRVHFGHGYAGAWEEALALVTFFTRTGNWQRDSILQRPVSRQTQVRARRLAALRVSRRIPLAYLIGEAWFAGLRFEVDKRVCIPRSPLAELIQDGFLPWFRSGQVLRVLELCTGSGCIGAACALYFPGSDVTATDISPAALSVAERNLRRLGLQHRVALREGDLFADAEGKFDLVIANPPYVPTGVYHSLPAEYRHEPGLALPAGADGLVIAERILQQVPRYLAKGGLLALEVGDVAADLAGAHPELPFYWPDLRRGGHGVLLSRAEDLSGRTTS